MKLDDKKIREILLAGNYITEADLKKADVFLKNHRTSFFEYLVAEGLISKNLLGQAVAESMKIPYADFSSHRPTQEQVLTIPEVTAKKWRIVFFSEKKTAVVIATDDPLASQLREVIQPIFPDKKISFAYALAEDIDASFVHYEKAIGAKFVEIIEKNVRVAPELMDAIFNDAIILNASDIHFEPTAGEVLVRFRIDGVLRDAGRLPREHYENVLNRIKVQSGIRLDEHYAAQDGALQFRNEGHVVDLRVSVVPTVEGEKVVLRVLSSYLQGLTLAQLGLSETHQKLFEETAQKPFGMIVVCGPTGSGKTTSLYALLKILNQSDVNITTIEDPVEYKMKGINQIQVNSLTGLTFAKGLRSVIRQDPDIILIGEIRDQETAEIGVNAALTGHLLLSTFHANDAATAIPRLLDMGIEPFLLASTLELIVAQRLARRICDHCRASYPASPISLIKKEPRLKGFFKGAKLTLYRGKGCDDCGHSGYKGRTAIFEFIPITSELQELILKNPSAQQIWQLARQQGSHSLFEDGLEKVKNGVTTIEELLRVAEPPQATS